MNPTAYLFVRVVTGCVGVLLLYMGLFLKEDAEGRIHDLLVEAWCRVDDIQKAAVPRHIALLQTASRIVTHTLDHLLGERLFSAQAIGICLCFSLASIFFVNVYFFPFNGIGVLHILTWAVAGLTMLVVGSLPAVNRKPLPGSKWFFMVIMGSAASFFLLYTGWIKGSEVSGRPASAEIPSFAIGLVAGLVFDIFFILGTRLTIRRATQMNKTWKFGIVFAFNLVAIWVIWKVTPELSVPHIFSFDTSDAIDWITASNFIDFLVASLVAVVALTMLAHRVFWPLLGHPLYAAQRLGIVGQRKLLTAIGIILIGLATRLDFSELGKVLGYFSG